MECVGSQCASVGSLQPVQSADSEREGCRMGPVVVDWNLNEGEN